MNTLTLWQESIKQASGRYVSFGYDYVGSQLLYQCCDPSNELLQRAANYTRQLIKRRLRPGVQLLPTVFVIPDPLEFAEGATVFAMAPADSVISVSAPTVSDMATVDSVMSASAPPSDPPRYSIEELLVLRDTLPAVYCNVSELTEAGLKCE